MKISLNPWRAAAQMQLRRKELEEIDFTDKSMMEAPLGLILVLITLPGLKSFSLTQNK
ncbi:MAG: hypothetical protein U9R52_01020 [Candidatus Omnitrophota bacterium]|nr:hypothetical protein [Candidatus Omnitrophota bacterium]